MTVTTRSWCTVERQWGVRSYRSWATPAAILWKRACGTIQSTQPRLKSCTCAVRAACINLSFVISRHACTPVLLNTSQPRAHTTHMISVNHGQTMQFHTPPPHTHTPGSCQFLRWNYPDALPCVQRCKVCNPLSVVPFTRLAFWLCVHALHMQSGHFSSIYRDKAVNKSHTTVGVHILLFFSECVAYIWLKRWRSVNDAWTLYCSHASIRTRLGI